MFRKVILRLIFLTCFSIDRITDNSNDHEMRIFVSFFFRSSFILSLRCSSSCWKSFFLVSYFRRAICTYILMHINITIVAVVVTLFLFVLCQKFAVWEFCILPQKCIFENSCYSIMYDFGDLWSHPNLLNWFTINNLFRKSMQSVKLMNENMI